LTSPEPFRADGAPARQVLRGNGGKDPLMVDNALEEEVLLMLPQDPNILLSYVNTKLRDQYGSLEGLCEDLGADPGQVVRDLAGLGYRYDCERNQFMPIS